MTCHYPTKQAYRTRKAANKALRFQPRLRKQAVSPYRCGDHWHLGRYAHEWVAAARYQSERET